MKSIIVAYIIAGLSIIIIIGNIWNAYPKNFDTEFFLWTISNSLILFSMIISVRYKKKQEQDSES